jgi:hypothetical protein
MKMFHLKLLSSHPSSLKTTMMKTIPINHYRFWSTTTTTTNPTNPTNPTTNKTMTNNDSTTTTPPSNIIIPQPISWLLKWFGYYGKDSTRIRTAQGLFRTCTERTAMPTWARCTGLKTNEFMPNHQLLLIHIWILNKKLLTEGPEGKKLQVEIFETLWENTERRMRGAGVNEMRIMRNLSEVQKVSFGALVGYDFGFKNTMDNNHELGSAVYRNLFASQPPSDEVVMTIASWMRSEVNRLTTTISLERLIKEGPHWTLPKGFIVTEEDLRLEEQLGQRGLWRKAISVEGKTYYWNVKTRESRWDKPTSMLDDVSVTSTSSS